MFLPKNIGLNYIEQKSTELRGKSDKPTSTRHLSCLSQEEKNKTNMGREDLNTMNKLDLTEEYKGTLDLTPIEYHFLSRI